MIQIQLADTDLQAYDDLSASLVDSLFGHSGGHQLIMIRKLNRNAYLIKLADNPLGICETDM
ncbi:Uncharacterised protein [Serratia fonticola]|uniref:Uncharacterized protein n=2 Tax=Serratia fonticola TaxID=47917 RepID=A0A4U9US63_SERFO|nr:Uncharacterised protein [Serratia fonticola]